jgi:hypothetical protein
VDDLCYGRKHLLDPSGGTAVAPSGVTLAVEGAVLEPLSYCTMSLGENPIQFTRRATATPASVVTSLEASTLQTTFVRRHGRPSTCGHCGRW